MRETCDETAFDRTDGVWENHWNVGRRAFDGEACWRRRDNNHVHFQPDHFGGKFLEAFIAPLGIATLDQQITTFLITEVLQAIEKRVIELLVTLREEAHAPDLASPLGIASERPCSHANECNKLTPPHA